MCLWYGDLIKIYIEIYLTRELKNDLHNSWYRDVGDCDADKQWLEMELKWVIYSMS